MTDTTPRRKGGRPRSIEAVEFTGTFDETLKFLEEVCSKQELYSKIHGRMMPITGTQAVKVVGGGLKHLVKRRQEELDFKEAYLLKRFSGAFRTLDADQPAPNDVIIAEYQSKRYQVKVQGGYCHQWTLGQTGDKVCALNQVTRWRPCVFSDKPVQVHSVRNDVMEALERGAALKNGVKA